MLYLIAAILFFLEGVGANFIPKQTVWGFFFLALGLCFGGPRWMFWKKSA